MIILTAIIIICYCIVIGAFIIGFDRVKAFVFSNNSSSKNFFSIIIPFRNEAQNLPELLKSLQQLNYSKDNFEIIFVDDNSKDASVELIEKFFAKTQDHITILKNERKTNSPKKDAISLAIKEAKYDWIITTDADCIIPKNWLEVFNLFIQKHQPKMIVAPVTYTTTESLLEQFQLLDFLSLQGSTIGAFGINKPFLCNGANLCYSKAIFNKVNGFNGNSTIASGDDIFLLEKIIKKYPNKVKYLKSKDAIVTTKPQPTFKELISQRIRWAAKSASYQNNFSKAIAIAVLTMNALLIILLIMSILGHFNWLYLLIIFLLKFSFDFVLIVKMASFFNQTKVLASVFISSIIYPFFSMFVVIASLTSGYQWKGRQFKQ